MKGLKKLCLFTGIVLMLFLALFCIIGSVMGAEWSKWFFNTLPGGGLLLSLGFLFIAEILEFGRPKIFLSAAGKWFQWSKGDAIAAILLLLVTVFIFSFVSLPPQLKSVFFIPHVFACFLSYVFFAKAAFFAVKYLFGKMPEAEEKSYGYVCIAFPLLTAGIVLGSIWAAFAWGDWWSWDPKETFSFAIWLIFAAFLHFRYLYQQRFLRLNSIWIITGFILIILSVLLVNFSEIFAGLHSHSS